MKKKFLILFALATTSFCFSQDNVDFDIEKIISELNIERNKKADLFIKQAKTTNNSSTLESNFNAYISKTKWKYNQPKAQQKQQNTDKLFSFLKSLNQSELSANSAKLAKLDSIVQFNVKTAPIYDSTLVRSEWNKLNDDSLLIERIITTYDSIIGEQKLRTIYEYTNPENFTRTTFNWDSSLNQWIYQDKSELGYNEQGRLTLAVHFDCFDNSCLPERKLTSEYNSFGKILNSSIFQWDISLNDWTLSNKVEYEYNKLGDLTQRISYQNFGEFGLIPNGKTIIEYDSDDGVTTTNYSWDLYNEEYKFQSEKFEIHFKEFDENGNTTFEFYEDFETPKSKWTKRQSV